MHDGSLSQLNNICFHSNCHLIKNEERISNVILGKTKCSNEEIGRFTSAFHHVVHSFPRNGLQSSPFYRSGSSNLENTIFAHKGLKLEILLAHFNMVSSKHLYFQNSYCTLAAILSTFPVNSRHGASDDKRSP